MSPSMTSVSSTAEAVIGAGAVVALEGDASLICPPATGSASAARGEGLDVSAPRSASAASPTLMRIPASTTTSPLANTFVPRFQVDIHRKVNPNGKQTTSMPMIKIGCCHHRRVRDPS